MIRMAINLRPVALGKPHYCNAVTCEAHFAPSTSLHLDHWNVCECSVIHLKSNVPPTPWRGLLSHEARLLNAGACEWWHWCINKSSLIDRHKWVGATKSCIRMLFLFGLLNDLIGFRCPGTLIWFMVGVVSVWWVWFPRPFMMVVGMLLGKLPFLLYSLIMLYFQAKKKKRKLMEEVRFMEFY